MTTEVVLLICCCIVVVLLIVFRKTSFVKKYWRYSLILIPAIVILVLKILAVIRQKTPSSQEQPNVLKDEITNIKDKLNEVNTVVKIEAAVAKEKNDVKMTELKEVQQIKDDRERRRRLAKMLG
jgi:glucan phosphoethanolaminetransferase (alkaline phosphatase superfamily)